MRPLHRRPFKLLVSLCAALGLVPACQGQAGGPGTLTPTPPGAAQAAPGPLAGSLSVAEATPATLAALGGSVATSLDTRGRPSFLWATGTQAAPRGSSREQAARFHAARHAASLGIPVEAVEAAELVFADEIGPGGEGGVIARLKQREGGVEVYRADIRVLMRRNLDLVALTGGARPMRTANPASHPFRLPPEQAIATALADRFASAPPVLAARVSPADVREIGGGDAGGENRLFSVDGRSGLHVPYGARARRVWLAAADSLVAAWFVEFYAGRAADADTQAWRYLVGAGDGRILERTDLTASDAFDYRVWAWTTGDKRPADGPHADFTPHPTGKPDGSFPAFVPPALIHIEGLNTNVFGAADPWLSPGSTQTLGNNVDAYTDRNPPDGFSNGDFRATTTGMGTFDRTYDVAQSPIVSNDQAMAGVTQLFYDANWLHDWWYDSGFNEAAGNAQFDNYGRGGLGGDVLHAEAQDGSGRNNANMSTPDDGFPPRMQIFLWNGPGGSTLTLNPGGVVASGVAGFGLQSFNLAAAAVVLANDGVATVTDACQPLVNSVTGKVVLVDRGTCSFKAKVLAAQIAGATGVIIADNAFAGSPPGLGDDANIPNAINIPVLSIKLADGNSLKAALMNGAVTAALFRKTDPDRDGAIGNTVIAHEWGHYLHHRLAQCGLQQCSAMSEGWADYNALQMILRDTDNLDGTYALAIYDNQAGTDSGYYGIRRAPYSTDVTKSAITFGLISDGAAYPNTPHQGGGNNSEVHNAGEIWAQMMWDAYVALQKSARLRGISFEDARRRMGSYVVAGLKLTPIDATYTEQRDAVLAAAAARDATDLGVLALAFAKRGAGTCAISPARDSTDLKGVVESPDLKPLVALGAVTLDDTPQSCDGDGNLDPGERGRITILLQNAGPVALNNTKVTLSTMTAGITFPNGAVVTVPMVAPYATSTITVFVDLDPAERPMGRFDLHIVADNAGACVASVSRDVSWRIAYDTAPAASTSDDVEADVTAWTAKGTPAGRVWSRAEIAPLSHAWRGIDYSTLSDTWLESPDLKVSAMGSFVIDLDHSFKFETDNNSMPPVYYDGAVIEVSDDAGVSWKDVSMWMDPGYGGTLTSVSGNPLSNRKALVDRNKSYPMSDHLKIDFGNKLAGKTVRVRFRIGTDQASSEFGWQLDNLAFTGIDNKPFAVVIDNQGKCLPDIVPDAGPDQAVRPSAVVVIDAGASISNKKRPLTFSWAQVGGPAVQLLHSQGATAAFGAPALPTPSLLVFEVTVGDGVGSAKAQTHVAVEAAPDMMIPEDMTVLPDLTVLPDFTVRPDLTVPPDLGTSSDLAPAPPAPESGCGCVVAGRTRGSAPPIAHSLALLILLGALLSRRRR